MEQQSPGYGSGFKCFERNFRWKEKIAILGSFPRLGEGKTAEQQYQYIANKVIETDVDKLIITDEKSMEIGKNAIMLGMNPNDIYYCFTDEAVSKTIIPFLTPGTIVLLKFFKN